MSIRTITLSTFIAVSAIVTGCKHDPMYTIGGKGGNASLIVYPAHHGDACNLDSMVVYIKYNATDAPADGVYDDSAICSKVNNLQTCTFSNLWNGNYYIFGKGYDYAVLQRVRGGLQYTIKNQAAVTISMPVSEDTH